MAKSPKFDTLMIHGGQTPDSATGSRAVPIYQTTSYVYENAQRAAEIFDLKASGYIYSRIDNPTVDVLEKRVALLEGGTGAVATASGMSAILYSVLNICEVGDEVVAAVTLYGGTHTLFSDRMLKQYGIKVHLVDADDPAAFEAKFNEKTRCVYFESMGNPGINIPDIEGICEAAHRHGIPVICDNTFGTPYLVQLKDHGVDIVVHSLTKYMGGHGTSIGGIVVDLGTFNWANGRYPMFTEPDETYHGVVYGADMPRAYITKLRTQLLRDTGACMSPFNAFLILQGIETLSLRMDRHCQNALEVANRLAAHDMVESVCYPALEGNKYYDRARKYFKKGCGAILTFNIKGGVAAGKTFIDSLELFSLLANVADAKSLVIHPASTTHGQMSEEALVAAGIEPGMIRLSIGLEDVEDIWEDLERGLEAARKG
ncbi:MAG: O-acetylhomoserine aminocarboxypropyltransferase/cysteine synthase [Clostridiales bacterium]|nr:O-acetylhomoserine aminocarboxypropyltransferase/cysteine synthase [Clostridiales bacterium]